MMETRYKKVLGYHTLLEFHGCPPSELCDSKKVENTFLEAAKLSQAHVINTTFHHFNPHGISGVVIISESHFAIHTWPEHGYAAIDFFSCSENLKIEKAIEYLKKQLKPTHINAVEFKRGLLL
jgi:S-adenosylmethionine decarboxylase proenzyme